MRTARGALGDVFARQALPKSLMTNPYGGCLVDGTPGLLIRTPESPERAGGDAPPLSTISQIGLTKWGSQSEDNLAAHAKGR